MSMGELAIAKDELARLIKRFESKPFNEWDESPSIQDTIQAQIAHTDRVIDKLVYGLYGLTEDEIGIVEGE